MLADWRPQAVDGDHMQTILVGIGALACGHHDAAQETVAEQITKFGQAAKLRARRSLARLL